MNLYTNNNMYPFCIFHFILRFFFFFKMIYGKEANLNPLAKIFSEFSSTPSLRLWPFLHLQTMLGESPLRLFKIFHDGVPGKHNQCL